MTSNHHDRRGRLVDLNSPADLVRAVLATQAVDAARAFLPLIQVQTDSQCGAILFGAMCTYYAKPFMSNRGLGQISPRVVPRDLRDTHEKLLLYRRKIATHSDSDHEHEGVAVNGVFFRSDGHHVIVEDRHLCPSGDFLAEVRRLLDAVRSRLSDAVERCLNCGPPSRAAYPPGLYRLTLEGEQEWSFVAVEDDHLDAPDGD